MIKGKRHHGAVRNLLWIMFSLFMLIAVSTLFAGVAPSVAHGFCWGPFKTGINSIAQSKGQPQKIIMGDCVGTLNFVNKGEIDDFQMDIEADLYDALQCPKNMRSFIIGIPYFEETESGFSIREITKDIGENIERWFERFRGIKPYCKGLDGEIIDVINSPNSEDRYTIKGPGGGKEPLEYCITLLSEKENYKVRFESKEKCQ